MVAVLLPGVKKLFWFISSIVVLVGIFGIFLYFQSKTAEGLTLTVTVPQNQLRVGVPFEIKVSVANNSDKVLQDARLTLSLPNDIVLVGEDVSKTFINRTIGSLGAGGVSEESYRVVALGGENTIKQVKVIVSYLPSSIGARFEQSQVKEFTVGESGVFIDVTAPQKVFSGEEFEVVMHYKNVSQIDFANLRLKLDYPSAFTIQTSSLEPDFDNNSWDLGDLRPNSEGKITLKGLLRGPDNAFFDLKAILSAGFVGGSYIINEKSATISISPSPLSLRVEVNGTTDYVAHEKENLSYTLTYTNNTEVALRDVIVRAKLSGEMFNTQLLDTNGALRSADNTIVWTTAQAPELNNVPVGGSGAVTFRIFTKEQYPIRRINDKNYTLKVSVEVESPTVPNKVASEKTIGQSVLETKVGGRLDLAAVGYFRDAGSGILNKGPYPPRVGQATNFTIHWRLKNTSTDVERIMVKAFLGPNVRFTGVAKSTTGILPVYNDRTQEIVWDVDRILATRGTLGDPTEAIFQVELIPGADQVGRYPTLLQETIMRATDSFTTKELAGRSEPVTTQTLGDSAISGIGNVQP